MVVHFLSVKIYVFFPSSKESINLNRISQRKKKHPGDTSHFSTNYTKSPGIKFPNPQDKELRAHFERP